MQTKDFCRSTNLKVLTSLILGTALLFLPNALFSKTCAALEKSEDPYVLVAENMENPLFDRAWVNARDFALNEETAGLHVMFQFSTEKGKALQEEIDAPEPPLLFMTFFEINRKQKTLRRGDYTLLDAQGITLSRERGWTEWEPAGKHNQGDLLLKVAKQLEEALKAQGQWPE